MDVDIDDWYLEDPGTLEYPQLESPRHEESNENDLVIEHQDQPSWTLEYADDTSDHAGSLFSEPEDDRDQMAPDSDMPKPVVTNENPVQTGGKGRSRVIEHWTALLNESTEDRTVSSEDEDEIEDEGVPNEQETRSQSSDIEQEGEEMEVDVPWDQMPSYKSCQIPWPDQSHVESVHIGDDIYVQPSEDSKQARWAGRIVGIRANTGHSVKISVRWFYSAGEFRSQAKKMGLDKKLPFDMHSLGRKELVLTDHCDIIPALSCNGRANVISFDERDIHQKYIDKSTPYTRITYHWNHDVKRKQTFPITTCCKKGYHPDKDTQYFCPRPACRFWCHDTCLGKFARKSTKGQSFETLLAEGLAGDYLNPDVDEGSSQDYPRTSPSKASSTTSYLSRLTPKEAKTLLERIAGQQIVRGSQHDIVGNALPVCKARAILDDIRKGRKSVADIDWKEDIGLPTIIRYFEAKKSPLTSCFKCRTCGGAI